MTTKTDEVTKANGHIEELPKIEMQLSKEEQREVWEGKRTAYLKGRLDAVIEYQLAELVKNEKAMKDQMERLKQFQLFIDHLNKEISTLE